MCSKVIWTISSLDIDNSSNFSGYISLLVYLLSAVLSLVWSSCSTFIHLFVFLLGNRAACYTANEKHYAIWVGCFHLSPFQTLACAKCIVGAGLERIWGRGTTASRAHLGIMRMKAPPRRKLLSICRSSSETRHGRNLFLPFHHGGINLDEDGFLSPVCVLATVALQVLVI